MADVWDGLVPEAELQRLRSAGFGAGVTLGAHPCLVVIDVVMSFLGSRPGREDENEYDTGCGEEGWRRLPTIVRVLEAARAAGIARVFTKGSPDAASVIGGAITLSRDPLTARRTHEAPFPSELVPGDGEFVLEKTKASAFFATPFLTYLHQQAADSLILVGTTTSGCVRATAVDGASYGYPVLVVEDACFDRSPFAHAANLFDIQMKYGSVVSSEELIGALDHLAVPREHTH